MNAISKLFSVNASCVLRWIWKFAKTHAQKPEVPNTQAVALELDEMWHSLGKKRNKLWICKAFDRNTGHLIDCECGGRDKQTLSKLVNRLSAFNVETYYTDNWQMYESVLPASKHVQTKAETHRIERNNCLMRHWFGRFKRKSIIVSKSVEMVEITIALFARFRVNGNVFDILNIADKTQVNTII
jgi:IS1 family transposase